MLYVKSVCIFEKRLQRYIMIRFCFVWDLICPSKKSLFSNIYSNYSPFIRNSGTVKSSGDGYHRLYTCWKNSHPRRLYRATNPIRNYNFHFSPQNIYFKIPPDVKCFLISLVYLCHLRAESRRVIVGFMELIDLQNQITRQF